MDELKVISAKVPDAVYNEIVLRVPEGDRSAFIRDAIMEKLQKTPKPDKIMELERRLERIEKESSEIMKYLGEIGLLTYVRGKVDPHKFGADEFDREILDFLLHYKGLTTPELAAYLKSNRWLVLNRLRRIQRASRNNLGKPIITYCAGERSGKKKAWWINEELIES